MSRLLALVILFWALVVGFSCGGVRGEAGWPLEQVRYRLDWSWGEASPLVGAEGWGVENDLGYRFRVTRGFLVTRGLELVPCAGPRAPAPQSSRSSLLERLLGSAVAWAGHSGTADPSALETPWVEALAKPGPSEPAVVRMAPERYCQAHYLVARGTAEVGELPHGEDMVGSTLRLEGSYRKPDEEAQTDFTLETAMAHGSLFALDPARPPGEPEGGPAGALVVVTRELGTLLGGVSPDSMAPRDVERRVLRNLIDGTTLTIQEQGPDA